MKKLFITALFALLMGGFAINANAQTGVTKNAVSQKEDPVSVFKTAVNTFETNLNTWKEGKTTEKINLQEDMKKAKEAKKVVKGLLPSLTEEQSTTYKELSDKLDDLITTYKELMQKK